MEKTAEIRNMDLVTAIEAAGAAIRKDTITPIFQAIRVRVSNGEVSVLANHYEASVRAIRKCSDGVEVDANVFYGSFLDSVKSMKGVIGVRETKEYLVIESGRDSIRSKKVDGEISDPVFDGDPIGVFRVNADEWYRSIERASLAVDKKNQNPALTGIHVAVWAASDHHDTSLAVVEGVRSEIGSRVWIPVDVEKCPTNAKFEFIVPADQADKIARLHSNTEDWKISVYENRIVFSGDRVEASAGKIDESFPDLASVFPSPSKYRVSVNRGRFSLALKRARLLSDDESRRIRLSVFRENGAAVLRVRGDGDFGETAEDLEIDFEEIGGELAGENDGFYHIYFNSGFVDKMIKASRGEKVSFGFSKSTEGALFYESERPDEWNVAIMPMWVG